MKILLLDLSSFFSKPGLFLRHSIFEPLGIEYLASRARQKYKDVRVLYPSSYREITKNIHEFSPNIVGFSVMTHNFSATLSIAKEIKRYDPKIITIFGGYHPSACPEIVKNKRIDFVVIGEGEKTFIELIEAIDKKGDLSKVRGISYLDNDVLVVTEARQRINDLDLYPFPQRNKSILKECKIFGLSYPPPSEQKSVCQFVYSRGCMFNCKFCNSYQVWGNKVIWRSPKNVVDEIAYVQREYGTNMLFFADLTFNHNKKRVLALCREIIDQRIKINWYAMCRHDEIDEEILAEMSKAGCTKISFGIDSLNLDTISKIKPSQNKSIDKIKFVLEQTNTFGIIIKAYLMIGFPWENSESVNYTGRILKDLMIDELRISFVTPFPGTALLEDLEKKDIILNKDYGRYTTDEPIIKVNGLSKSELITARERIFKSFYFSKEYETRKKAKLLKFPHLKKSYDEFYDFLGFDNVPILETRL